MSTLDVHVLHDADGRILAIAPVAHVVGQNGERRGVTPVAADGQFVLRLTLTEEHTALGPVAVVRDYAVDLDADEPALRPRSAR